MANTNTPVPFQEFRAKYTSTHRVLYDAIPKPNSYPGSPMLDSVKPQHLPAIYTSIIEGRRFLTPVPLSFVVTALSFAWNRDGLVDNQN